MNRQKNKQQLPLATGRGPLPMVVSRVVTNSPFSSVGCRDLFPKAKCGDLNPKAKSSVSSTVKSLQPPPTRPAWPCQKHPPGNAPLHSWHQRLSLEREGAENSGSNCLTFLLWTHNWILKQVPPFCCVAQRWTGSVERGLEGSAALQSALPFLLIYQIIKCPDASLQRKASKDTTQRITPLKQRACPRTRIVILGTDTGDTETMSPSPEKKDKEGRQLTERRLFSVPTSSSVRSFPRFSQRRKQQVVQQNPHRKKLKGCPILEFY